MYVADKAIRPQLRIRAEAPVPTRFGEFRMVVFHFGEPDVYKRQAQLRGR